MAVVPPHIKIARKAFRDPASGGDPFWNEPRKLSRWEAWQWILNATAFSPHAWALQSGQVLELRCGETKPLSVRYLMGMWRWGSKKTVAAFLATLREMGRIAPGRKTSDGDTYLLLNYEFYQFGGDRVGDSSGYGVRRGIGYSDGDSGGDRGDVGAQGRAPGDGDSNGDGQGDGDGDSGGDNTYTGNSRDVKETPSGSVRSRRQPRKPSKSQPRWSTEAGEMWKQRHDGTANYGRIGKALVELVDAKGWPEVRKAWENYLAGQELDYQSAEHFAEHYGEWAGTVKNGKKPEDLTPDELRRQQETAAIQGYQDAHKRECKKLWEDAQAEAERRELPESAAKAFYRTWVLDAIRAGKPVEAPAQPGGMQRVLAVLP